jgi:hypothetical protein
VFRLGCPGRLASAGSLWMQSLVFWASSRPPPAAVGASIVIDDLGNRSEVTGWLGPVRVSCTADGRGANAEMDGIAWRGPSLLAAAAASGFEFLEIHGQLTGRGLGRGALQGRSAVS